MRFLIIGLGIYGSNLALDLTDMGHEVVGADCNATNAEAVKDNISTVYVLDSTDEAALSVVPLKNIDLVIVAIGENFGASIRTVAILKKFKVEHIYARAIDTLHEAILESFQIERILKPEQQAAKILANELQLGAGVDIMDIDSESSVVKFLAPETLEGSSYPSLDFSSEYNIRLIAAVRKEDKTNILGISQPADVTVDITDSDEKVRNGDRLVCFGKKKSFLKLYRHLT